ncbi:MAG: putative motility protein [Clostridium sp.]|nr:putative motility protein [Clostridium sp.]
MDIGSLSIAMTQSSVQTQIGTALLKMSIDNSENIAENLNAMMGKIAVDTNLGNSIDVRV